MAAVQTPLVGTVGLSWGFVRARHAERPPLVLRRILTIGLIALGVIVIGLAIASATLWRSSDTVTASGPAEVEQPFVVTDAGVLELVADDVTVTATAPDGGPVVLAVGREPDVRAWVADSPYLRITGLSSWTGVDTAVEEGEPAPEGEETSVPSPAGSDMWVAEATGEGEATLEWTHPGGRWSLLAAADGTSRAPAVVLSWPQVVSTPFLVPGLVVGGVLLLGGLALLVVGLLERREVSRRDAARAEEAAATGEVPAVAVAATGTAAGVTGTATDTATVQLTRRQLRERDRATGALPAVGAGGGEAPARPEAQRETQVGGEAAPASSTAEETGPPDAASAEPVAGESPWRRVWGMRSGTTEEPTGKPTEQEPGATDEEDRA